MSSCVLFSFRALLVLGVSRFQLESQHRRPACEEPDDSEEEDTDDSQEAEYKFTDIHLAHFRQHSLSYPPQYSLHYSEEQIQALQAVPERSREIIFFWDQIHPLPDAPHEETIDVGQTIFRAPHCLDASTCLLPNSLIWLRRAFRLLVPSEALLLQGLPLYTYDELEQFRTRELNCLAGNAFCGNNALALMAGAIAAHPSLFTC